MKKPEGALLSSLPIILKYKLPFKFDKQELGYQKLRDLLADMRDVIWIKNPGTG
jgi:hypothetical protein